MAKFLKRLTGQTIEESLLIQCKITNINFVLDSDNQYENLQVEWHRGDTVSRSRVFGETDGTKVANFDLADTFTQLSIFYKEARANPPKYQKKMAELKIYGTVVTGEVEGRRKSVKQGLQQSHKVPEQEEESKFVEEKKRVEKTQMLGSLSVDLSTYVGKLKEEVTLPIAHGRIKNGQIRTKISVVGVQQAREIGVDPRQLLLDAPPEMMQLGESQPTSEQIINEAEKDMRGMSIADGSAHERVGISANAISMKEQEVDEQLYLEMSQLKDENNTLKESVEHLTAQNRVLRTKVNEEKIQLEYFGPFGRADPLRFLLYFARVDFDDLTITQEQWG